MGLKEAMQVKHCTRRPTARAGGNGGGAVGAGVEEGILELLRKTKEPTQRALAGASGQRGRRKGDGWTDLAKYPVLEGHAWVSNIRTTQASAIFGPTESVLAKLRMWQAPSEGHTCA